jgi:glycosyltransferase involved in cell wall biosynthesis
VKTSVVVATYNAPHQLELVLEGLARQSQQPDEVLVADDGSGEETRALLERWAASAPWPLQHVWHADDGFRKWTISNEAVRRSTGDWLLFLDGDAIPHSRWLADHVAASQRGDVLCGRRLKLGPTFTPRVDAEWVRSGRLEGLFSPVVWGGLFGDNERIGLGLRVPAGLAHLFHPKPRKLMGVNFSVSRAAFEAVNGWDEEWPGRRGDRDLDLRLVRSKARFVALLNRGVVHHLFHHERPNSDAIQARVQQEERSDRVRCFVGLKKDLSGAPS